MAEQGSKYENWFKREVTRIFLQNNSTQETIAIVQKERNITISERTLYNWKKKYQNEIINGDSQPVLFVDNSVNNTMNISPMKNPPRNFDYTKWITKYKNKFNPHDKKLKKVFDFILDSVNPANEGVQKEIKKMKFKERLQSLNIIIGMQRDEFNLMMELFSKINNEDDLAKIMEGFQNAVNNIDSPAEPVAIQ